MIVDVSEMKTFRNCKRQWALSSRNYMHLRPRTPNPNLLFGSVSHNMLHAMYLGAKPEKLIEQFSRELADDVQRRVFSNITNSYYDQVLPDDLSKYKVIDIEHRFALDIGIEGMEVHGSIDMLALEPETGLIHGFEHKFVGKFRPDLYNVFDEQPRVYYAALIRFVEKYNADHGTDYKPGKIFLNEIKKVQRSFEFKRTPLEYTREHLDKFFERFILDCCSLRNFVEKPEVQEFPEPSYMKCQMCDFKTICAHFQLETLNPEDVIAEFSEEYEVRDIDHLEEKREQYASEE
jgi:hypothetical protein